MQSYRVQRFRITKVWAKNFRSIADTSVELDDLTVLVGLNASGKSNLLDVLRFVKDALNFDLEAAISMRRGIRAIRRRTQGGRPPNIEIDIHADAGDYSIEYGFTIGSVKAEEYKVKREYGKIWSDDAAHPVEFRIEDGALVSSGFLMSGRLRSRWMLEEEEPVDLQLRNMLIPIRFTYDTKQMA